MTLIMHVQFLSHDENTELKSWFIMIDQSFSDLYVLRKVSQEKTVNQTIKDRDQIDEACGCSFFPVENK